VAEGVAYVGGATGDVFALDVLTGAERWSARIDGSSSTAPAVSSARVIVATTQGDLDAIQR
jgi:outer membrane protein assembly factor BamB